MDFRYRLDKSSKKYVCNKCLKKTMVRYIDTETNNLMPINFGRCDKESSCGFFEIPKGRINTKFEYSYKKPLPISYHNPNLIIQTGRNYKQNNFIQFLKTLFTEDEVKEVIKKYLIGTSKKWKGATIFWQIDNNEKVRHGKIMLYSSETGKRQKNELDKAYISSVRCVLKLKDYNLNQCLFGLHLINEDESKTLAIVESEKTAILMSMFKPEYIWLATGSKSGFKCEYLKPLRNYKIIGFPDKSEYYDWNNKANELNSLGFNIKVSDFLEETPYPDGTDLADVYLLCSKQEQIINENIVETKTEKLVAILVKKNPAILQLIKIFDLVDENGININANY